MRRSRLTAAAALTLLAVLLVPRAALAQDAADAAT